jgi:hypothetical protein
MKSNRDLLKEAIADAKAVKETAIANAKAALEEAFTPQLKSMLSQRLAEMEEADDTEEYGFGKNKADAGVGFGSMGEKALDETDEEKEGMYEADEEEEAMNEIDLEELLAEFEEAEDEEEAMMEADDEEEAMMEAEEEEETMMEADDEEEAMMEAEEEEEVNLEELLAELEEAEEEEKEEEAEEETEEGSDEDIDIESMSKEEFKSFIEDTIKDMFSSGELSSDMMSGGEEEESKPLDEYTLEELLAEMKAKNSKEKSMKKEAKKEKEPVNEITDTALMLTALGTAFGIPAAAMTVSKLHDLAKAGKLGKAGEKVAAFLEKAGKATSPKNTGGGGGVTEKKEDKAKSSQLEEMGETINELRNELNEVNLLNAKLLYTNKVFKNKSLNEAQKVKVLTAFDKANSVKEAKLVYETLMESLKLKKSPVNESMGFASKTIGATKAPIVESNGMVERFKKLAGIN